MAFVAGLLMAWTVRGIHGWRARRGASAPPPVVASGTAPVDGGGADRGPRTVAPRVEAPEEAAAAPSGVSSLAGTVVDEDGRPVVGAQVRVMGGGTSRVAGGLVVEPAGELGVVRAPIPYPPLDGPPVPGGAAAGTAGSPRLPSTTTVTDGAGRFRVDALPPGRVAALVSHPDFLDGRSGEVTLVAEREAPVRVTLRRAMVVRGRVRDSAGGSVVGAELWIDRALAAVSDRKGRWELRRAPGPFDVEVRMRGRSPLPQHIDPAFRAGIGGDVELGVGEADPASGEDPGVAGAAGGIVEGEIVDARGGLVPGARAFLVDPQGVRRAAVVDRTGRFRITGCPPGPATLRGEAPGYLPAQAAVDLRASDRTDEVVLRDVRITLAEAGVLGGTVRDRWGEPVPGATVEGGGARGRTDAAGRFTLSPLPAGQVQVLVTAPQGAQVSERAYIEPGRPAEVDIRFH